LDFGTRKETYCVNVNRYGSDVTEPPLTVTYERPALMWSGVAAVSAGTVLLFLPKRAQRVAPTVAITPTGWLASKTVTW